MSRPGNSGRRFGLVLALMPALIGACGATGPATTRQSDGPGTSSAAASRPPGGSIGPATPRPAGAYALTLPTGWRKVRIGSDYVAAATRYAATSPRFASSLQAQLAALPATASGYAYDGSDATVRDGVLVALTITEVTLPADVSLDAFSAEIGRQVSQLVEKDVPPQRILTASGAADQLVYEPPFDRASGATAVAAVTQVLLVVPGRGYVLTFSTTPARAAQDGPVFAEIARSIILAP